MVETTHGAIISGERLAAFRERLVLRDLRARGPRPALRRVSGGLAVDGPFWVRRRVRVDKARGVEFVEATGDPNPIHREGEVVPGAFVAAEIVSAVEILFPDLALSKLRVSFTGVSWYGRSIRLSLRCIPTPPAEDGPGRGGMRFEAVAHQDRREVATAVLEGALLAKVPQLELPLDTVDAQWLMRVVHFYQSLGIDPEAHFHKKDGPDLSYPIAFLASLPSGSMVERLSGQGGILNRLTLEFTDARLPLVGPPEVGLKPPRRLRQSFNRILTWVKEGVQTAVRGTALVLPKPPQDLLSDAPTS